MAFVFPVRHVWFTAILCVAIGWAAPRALAGSGPANPSTPESRVIPPSRSYAVPDSEYVYSVQWQMFHAGSSTVRLENAKNGMRVSATADSAGLPDKFFKVHDVLLADVNPRTFCTDQVIKHNLEGPHRRDFSIILDYAHGKSHVETKDLKTSEVEQTEFDIPACVTDVISGFFYVASLPLAPGYTQVFPVNDNGKTTDARLQVEGRERVKEPAGEFETLRVKIEPVSGAMKDRGTLWVWFTDDARHVPVQMKSKLKFATFIFQLQKMGPPAVK